MAAKKKAAKAVRPVRTDEQIQADKKEAFVRVVTPRMDKAIKAMRNVSMCASPNYVYSEEQKRAVIAALEVAFDEVKAAFGGEQKSTTGFVLPA